jgi:hypothetical protein
MRLAKISLSSFGQSISPIPLGGLLLLLPWNLLFTFLFEEWLLPLTGLGQ